MANIRTIKRIDIKNFNLEKANTALNLFKKEEKFIITFYDFDLALITCKKGKSGRKIGVNMTQKLRDCIQFGIFTK